jgi:nitrilase
MTFAHYGHSMIVNPWGKIIAELPDGPGVITAEIDLDYLAKVRGELPALKHRRLS